MNNHVTVTSGYVERKKKCGVKIFQTLLHQMDFRSISSRQHVVNKIVQSALINFHILSNLLDSQHVDSISIKEVGTSGLKYCQLSKTFLIFNINAHSVHLFQF